MHRRSFIMLITTLLIFFVLASLFVQSVCDPKKNPVTSAVTTYVEQQVKPMGTRPPDPLSYDGVWRAIAQWISNYCAK